jgi:hypothetical protein
VDANAAITALSVVPPGIVLAGTADGRLHAISASDGSRFPALDLVAATPAAATVAALGPARRRCVLSVHLGCTVVATPLPEPMVAVREPEVFSFTSGRGRWTSPGARR